MIHFELLEPCDTVTGSGRDRRTASEIVFSIRGVLYFIAAGFLFDGCSVPFFLWWWVSPWDLWVICAAAIHDWIYRTRPDGISRHDADRVFLVVLCDGARRHSRWRWLRYRRIMQARAMYHAVRAAGVAYWGDDDQLCQYRADGEKQ